MFANVIGILAFAFVTGALARFAVPGPDPMPAWLTILIGFTGIGLSSAVLAALGSWNLSWALNAGFPAAIVLVALYRRFVQKRPLWGPGAYRFPERGLGVQAYRERLKSAGIDPDQIGAPLAGPPAGGTAAPPRSRTPEAGMPTENPAHYLGLLEELHDAGVLSEDEYGAARLRLLEQLRG